MIATQVQDNMLFTFSKKNLLLGKQNLNQEEEGRVERNCILQRRVLLGLQSNQNGIHEKMLASIYKSQNGIQGIITLRFDVYLSSLFCM